MRTLLISEKRSESDWLGHALRESAHSLQYVQDVRDGIFIAGQEPFDFIIVMAFEPCSYSSLRTAMSLLAQPEGGSILVALLGPASACDRVRVLRAGADACFSHPHSFLELNERLRALWRMRSVRTTDDKPVNAAVRLDPTTRELVAGDSRVALTQREHMLLECLLRQPGAPVSRAELMAYAWPEADDTDPTSVNSMVSRLRRKLAHGLPRIAIDTVSRYGYRIAVSPPRS